MSDATSNPLRDEIQKAISENHVILFMKGTPNQPACGLSARTVAVLESVGQPFAAVDILPDPRIRQELVGPVQLAHDPAAVRRRRAARRRRHRRRDDQSGELHETLGLEAAQVEPTQPEAAAAEAPPLSIENRLQHRGGIRCRR